MHMALRVCRICGKQFETTVSRRQICYDKHIRTCKVCGKQFEITSVANIDKVTCSVACTRQYNKGKYQYRCTCKECGATFLSSSPNSTICPNKHYRKCKSCGEMFEVSKYEIMYDKQTCSNECKLEYIQTKNAELYSDPIRKSEVVNKQHATMLERYGVDNPMKSRQFVEKAQKTSLERYGETSFTKTDAYLKKSKETNQERYGADWHAQTAEHRKQVVQTCLEKYGVDNPSKVGKHIAERMTDPALVQNLVDFHSDPDNFVSLHFPDELPTLRQLGDLCGVRDSSIGDIVNRLGKRYLIRYTYSTMEDEMYEFLSDILPDDVEILRNTFQYITPYELDVYIPKYKLAIECDPTITHNSSIPGFRSDDKPKARSYHRMKTDMCETFGIRLIHVFGYDWEHHKDIIKSMISADLGQTSNKIYARQCDVRPVSALECAKFLDNNHRQGNVFVGIRYGLYYKDELVSVMTFSKMRSTIGIDRSDLSDCYELVRFCNKLNTSVVGGASKLFKHFVRSFNPKRVRSFSDRAHTSGGLYNVLGFKYIRTSDPGYVWVNLKTDEAYSRVNAQKRNIVNFLHDDSIDLSKTETEIMEEHGFVQVFDSGTILWEWRKE